MTPNGHEIEGALTAMNLDFSLSSFTSIPIASSPTAFLSASTWGHGGPDVTSALHKTLDEATDFWKPLNGWQKARSAYSTRINTHAWEIIDLFDLTPEGNSICGLEAGTGDFKGTVAVNGEVYEPSAVNFALFGKISRLAYDYYVSHHDPADAAPFSLTATKAYIRAWKRLAVPVVYTIRTRSLTWPDVSYETGYMAEAFGAWGYGGNALPRGYVTTPSREAVRAGAFRWRWMPYHEL